MAVCNDNCHVLAPPKKAVELVHSSNSNDVKMVEFPFDLNAKFDEDDQISCFKEVGGWSETIQPLPSSYLEEVDEEHVLPTDNDNEDRSSVVGGASQNRFCSFELRFVNPHVTVLF
ncbi:hypothetical protein V8G54_028474 [Vigna mungo]|uniref:Uncharacterized protein n=1 Tax=Vigna mungo TaxID=3915 RepID=A0AAQ3MSU1_VIGMU